MYSRLASQTDAVEARASLALLAWLARTQRAILATTMSELLVATWEDGVFAVSERGCEHELAGHSVQQVTTDGHGGVLAVVDGCSVQRRSREGAWTTVASAGAPLRCCVASQGNIYVGTDDARVLCLALGQELVALEGFERVQGRETWRAGQALVNGEWLGPPLGVRSISATPEGALLANVHVGGIPRSTDAGRSWQPTIEVEADVHEVRAHPSRPEIVAAAAAAGLCLSVDGGATWSLQRDGLHDSYCSAVAFLGNDVLVAASEGHFATTGRIYRRAIDQRTALSPLIDGSSAWTDGIVDTYCIGVSGSRVAFADHAGKVYFSRDGARTWSTWSHRLPSPSSLQLL
jgi:hypothetical protein